MTHEKEKKWLTIIGIGEAGPHLLVDQAKNAIRQADYIFGASRHLLRVAKNLILTKNVALHAWPKPFLDMIPKLQTLTDKNVVVLVTGDPMHFGAGVTLHRYFKREEMVIFSYPSSFSLAANRLGWALQDVTCCSIHGRPLENLAEYLKDNKKLFILSHDKDSPYKIEAFLKEQGFGKSQIVILEQLGGVKEKKTVFHEIEKDHKGFSDLNLVAVYCRKEKEVSKSSKDYRQNFIGLLHDSFFAHNGQMTKQNIRAINLLHLAPNEGDTLLDIGAGCGSISIEWLYKGKGLTKAIAIEKNPDQIAYIKKNSTLIDKNCLQIIEGLAEQKLDDLPSPDAIFIGGGASNKSLVEKAWKLLKPNGRLVMNAVTVESEQIFYDFVSKYQNKHDFQLLRIQMQERQALGQFHVWRPALPVLILVCKKNIFPIK